MPQQIKNPFLHSHDEHDHHHHGHDHHHDHEDDLQQLDPAQQSLADALRVSFTILKVLMVLLLIAYLFSGAFWVEQNERVVRLRFGSMVGEPGQQVHEPGWHFGLPYPIEQVVRVPVVEQTLNIQQAFWPEQIEQAAALNPERDGSLLTGDANIMHVGFNLNYVIADPAAFLENVGLARPGVDRLPDGTAAERTMDLADALMRGVAEQAIVNTVAHTDADQIYRGTLNTGHAVNRMAEVLGVEGMNTGIEVVRLTMERRDLPRSVQGAAQEVTNAESQRAQAIEQARQEQARILGETAGAAHRPLFELIYSYEMAHGSGDVEQAEALRARIDSVIENLALPLDAGELAIGGEVAQVINGARSYRSAIGQEIAAEASLFQAYLEEHRSSPRLLQARLWLDAKQHILAAEGVETFHVMPGQFYPVISRDPALQRQRERDRLRQEAEQARERQSQR